MMNRKKHLSKFNLVEIVLAIGVVALGMAAVLALLPPALNANRASQGDANTTEIAKPKESVPRCKAQVVASAVTVAA